MEAAPGPTPLWRPCSAPSWGCLLTFPAHSPQTSPPCQVGLLASLTLVQTVALTPRTGSHPDCVKSKKAFVPRLKLWCPSKSTFAFFFSQSLSVIQCIDQKSGFCPWREMELGVWLLFVSVSFSPALSYVIYRFFRTSFWVICCIIWVYLLWWLFW